MEYLKTFGFIDVNSRETYYQCKQAMKARNTNKDTYMDFHEVSIKGGNNALEIQKVDPMRCYWHMNVTRSKAG